MYYQIMEHVRVSTYYMLRIYIYMSTGLIESCLRVVDIVVKVWVILYIIYIYYICVYIIIYRMASTPPR